MASVHLSWEVTMVAWLTAERPSSEIALREPRSAQATRGAGEGSYESSASCMAVCTARSMARSRWANQTSMRPVACTLWSKESTSPSKERDASIVTAAAASCLRTSRSGVSTRVPCGRCATAADSRVPGREPARIGGSGVPGAAATRLAVREAAVCPLDCATEAGRTEPRQTEPAVLSSARGSISCANTMCCTGANNRQKRGCSCCGCVLQLTTRNTSSLDRKWKREKAARFSSRWRAKPLVTPSSVSMLRLITLMLRFPSANFTSKPVSSAARIVLRHTPSTARNAATSFGSCWTMSSEDKIGCKKAHARCQRTSASKTRMVVSTASASFSSRCAKRALSGKNCTPTNRSVCSSSQVLNSSALVIVAV
mmetsp:Transcript_24174/g.61190  ORF Transcript_24174/g.61190 Transcript_24174/m.61190 type:complete len:369 (-) Transcript_24174:1691-2797(-)